MNNIAMNTESRISTSSQYFTKCKATTEQKLRGLNKIYYNMFINASTNDPREISMLSRMKTTHWSDALLCNTEADNVHKMKQLVEMTAVYKTQINTQDSEEKAVNKLKMVGKRNARSELAEFNEIVMGE